MITLSATCLGVEIEVTFADARPCACKCARCVDAKRYGVACFVGTGACAGQAAHAVGIVGKQAFPAIVGALRICRAGFSDPALCGCGFGCGFVRWFGRRFGCGGFRGRFGRCGFGRCGFVRWFGRCGFRRDGFGCSRFGCRFGKVGFGCGGFGEWVAFGATVLLGDHNEFGVAAAASWGATTGREPSTKAEAQEDREG